MIVAAIVGALALVLFFGAFISRRRFGLLGLALTAGATLSTLWSYEAGLVISSTGLVPAGPITNAVALAAIVLLPAIVLLFHGYTYKGMVGRIVGSLLFSVLALAFLLEPLEFILPLEGQTATLYATLNEWKGVAISVGVIAAVIDLFFTKPAKNEHDKKRR